MNNGIVGKRLGVDRELLKNRILSKNEIFVKRYRQINL